MKFTVNTDVLQHEHLTMGDFLVLLMGYYNANYKECLDRMKANKLVSTNVFNPNEIVLSNNTKDLITSILISSDDRIINSGIDYTVLAEKLQALYPKGNKSGTTYSWTDKTKLIAQKLCTLVVEYNFSFTEQEALKATEEYVKSFSDDKSHMQLLKYFILKTSKDNDMESMFMTIIENNRQHEENSN